LSTSPDGPYNEDPVTIPAIIQAEEFDFGRNNVAYYDTTAANLGNADVREPSGHTGTSVLDASMFSRWV